MHPENSRKKSQRGTDLESETITVSEMKMGKEMGKMIFRKDGSKEYVYRRLRALGLPASRAWRLAKPSKTIGGALCVSEEAFCTLMGAEGFIIENPLQPTVLTVEWGHGCKGGIGGTVVALPRSGLVRQHSPHVELVGWALVNERQAYELEMARTPKPEPVPQFAFMDEDGRQVVYAGNCVYEDVPERYGQYRYGDEDEE